MLFVGLDLAWKMVEPGPLSTGICVLEGNGQVRSLGLLTTDNEILETVLGHDNVWMGIDAPLRVPNEKGMRRCERELLGMGLHCLPSNRDFMDRRFGGRRGERLAEALKEGGFMESPSRFEPGRAFFEVYPHGALQVLMGEVPPYKRGSFIERKRAMMKVIEGLGARDAPRGLAERLRREVRRAKAPQIKEAADLIDAAISVMCVYAHWRYEGKRTRLVGEEEHGFVLLPAQRQ